MVDLKGVDISMCKFFGLNEKKQLKFKVGKYNGKCVEDFKDLDLREAHSCFGYCMWMLRDEEIPMISKHAAAQFMDQLIDDVFKQIPEKIRKIVIEEERRLAKETAEAVKTPGKKYI